MTLQLSKPTVVSAEKSGSDITNMHEITLGLLIGSQYYNVRNELDNHINIIMNLNQK